MIEPTCDNHGYHLQQHVSIFVAHPVYFPMVVTPITSLENTYDFINQKVSVMPWLTLVFNTGSVWPYMTKFPVAIFRQA